MAIISRMQSTETGNKGCGQSRIERQESFRISRLYINAPSQAGNPKIQVAAFEDSQRIIFQHNPDPVKRSLPISKSYIPIHSPECNTGARPAYLLLSLRLS